MSSDEDNLEFLSKKRCVIRNLINSIMGKIDGILKEENIDISELEGYNECFVDKFSILKNLDQEIEMLIPLDSLEIEISESDVYRQRSLVLQKKVLRVIKNDSESSNKINVFGPKETATMSRIKLPKLIIEKFAGDYSLWSQFWNSYESTIDLNETLSKIEKFSYLKSLLVGNAANAINGLKLSDDNYDAAVKILKNRYGRKDIVISSHVNKLLSLEPVRNSRDIYGLRKLYDSCEVQIRNLESLNVASGSYGNLLCPILIKLIPEDMSLEFNRKRKIGDNFEINELIEFLKAEVECREATNLMYHSSRISRSSEFSQSSNKIENQNKFNTRKAFSGNSKVTTAFNASVRKDKCLFCDGNHDSRKCENSLASDNINVLKRQGRCFICFKKYHTARYCYLNSNRCKKCNKKNHSELVCVPIRNQIEPKPITEDEMTKLESHTLVSPIANTTFSETVLLETLVAEIVYSNQAKNVRCLLDTASMRSFISKSVVEALRLPVIGKESLSVYTFGSEVGNSRNYDLVRVKLRSRENPFKNVYMELLVTESISSAHVQIPSPEICEMLKRRNLPSVEFSLSTGDGQIDLLIGADFYFNVCTGNICRLNESLTAVETLFGFTVLGKHAKLTESNNFMVLNESKINNQVLALNIGVNEIDAIEKTLRMFWDLEGLGIEDPMNENKGTAKDLKALEYFNKDIEFKNGRYEVSLPFKDKINISNNYTVAKRRLWSLLNRFKSDPALYKEYDQIIQTQIKEGIVERVEDHVTSSKEYYMPHHPVVRNDKETTKVRIVYDASSKENNNYSLNDNLMAGPNLNPNLLSILLKFRENKVAFVADIERAFLQISIRENQRDFAKFLWIDKFPPEDIITYRMTRVTFGVTSSPFLLAATLKHHIAKYRDSHPEVFKILNESLYVDDLIAGKGDVCKALNVAEESKKILIDAGMNLRKWRTNSKELSKVWHDTRFEQHSVDDSLIPIKVLGIIWDIDKDTFKLEISSVLNSLNERKNTKRSVLKITCKLFDPIGFISPFIVRMKMLFQEVWQAGIDWDDELPYDLKVKWNSWCGEVPELQNLSIPRRYFENNTDSETVNLQAHIFCDASQRAFGAVAYWRYFTEEEDFDFETSFIMSKSRVAPVKKITLPRLELMGALIAARLTSHLKEVFKLRDEKIFLHTDSQIVLHWIKGSASQWKPFVSNRVIEIQERTEPKCWRHCRGLDNPADILSRGINVREVMNNLLWMKGPNWLRKSEDEWPQTQINRKKEDILEEMRCSKEVIAINCVNEDIQDDLLTRFSSWIKLQRVFAWCLRFINNMSSREKTKGYLTAEELNNAAGKIIKRVQRSNFSKEISSLKAGKAISPQSKLISLNPFLDKKEVLRVGGRLKNAEIAETHKHPAILPKVNHVTNLIIRHYHYTHLHGGIQMLLSAIRQMYWIVNAKDAIRKCIWKCIKCCRHRAETATQLMSDLPPARVVPCRVFSKIGVDFAGPFQVKMRKGRGVTPTKCYICVFICFATKAIHLEIVSGLSSEDFIAALKRFASRRGKPREISSDCGTNFIGADKELRKVVDTFNSSSKFQNHLSTENIKWNFNPPSAPHHGGLWEAAVKSMKHHLRRSIGKQILTYEELLTLITQIEACLNSRPLVPVSNDPSDLSAITPGHFLIGAPLTTIPESDLTEQTVTPLQRWKLTQQLFQTFWKRWNSEYLSQLQQRSKWRKESPNLKVNDLVLIKEDNQPPLFWKLGRINEVYPGSDSKVRVVKVKTQSGELKRPITKVSPLPYI